MSVAVYLILILSENNVIASLAIAVSGSQFLVTKLQLFWLTVFRKRTNNMALDTTLEQRILEKIRQLPLNKVIEVEDFIDFLTQRVTDHDLTMAATKMTEPVFQKIWDNPNDAEYDHL